MNQARSTKILRSKFFSNGNFLYHSSNSQSVYCIKKKTKCKSRFPFAKSERTAAFSNAPILGFTLFLHFYNHLKKTKQGDCHNEKIHLHHHRSRRNPCPSRRNSGKSGQAFRQHLHHHQGR